MTRAPFALRRALLRGISHGLLRSLPVLLLAASGLVRAQAQAQAQPWPNKPVRIVIPFSPGGTTDLLARLLAQGLAQNTGQQFVAENKLGAGGAIAAVEVARAPADGSVLFVTTGSTHSIAPALNPNLRYHPVNDFTPLAHLADSDLVWLASPSLPAKNIAELLALARAKPGSINYTSSGVGTAAHLVFEQFKQQTGVELTHIPYKGTGGAISDLMSGVVQLSLDAVATGLPHTSEGRLRALAVTGMKRSPLAPDVATINETVPGFSVVLWFGLYGPRGISPEVVQRIHDEVAKVMKSPETLQRFKAWGIEPGRGMPADFAAMVAADSARWAQLVKDRNIKIE